MKINYENINYENKKVIFYDDIKNNEIDISNEKNRILILLKDGENFDGIIKNTSGKIKNVFLVGGDDLEIKIEGIINVKTYGTGGIIVYNAKNSFNKNTKGNAENRETEGDAKNMYTEGNAENRETEGNAENRETEGDAKNMYTEGNAENWGTEGNAENLETKGNAENWRTKGDAENWGTEGNAKNINTEGNASINGKNDNFPWKFLPLSLKPKI